ncbi:MAG: histidinol-phosphate transaminase [Candidatus Lokiarchaeota archaeon]|nr:histidinol-phosphate transaminase [Candidatus Lokiarchaeota archaeon]
MDIKKIVRSSLRNYSAYEPGEQPQGGGWIKLNSNENPYPPIPEVLKEIKKGVNEKVRLYPDPTALEVRKAILNQLLRDKNTLTNRNTVFIGNGADEVLDNLFKLFIDPGDEVVFFYPSYGMYKVLAELYNAKINEIRLKEDFSIPDSAFSATGKLMLVNSPNNPNGRSFGNEIIQKLCESFPGIVVVDETYADFSDKTALPLLKDLKNLIVMKSFSKSFSLAGLRFGFAIADASIIKELNKVKLPFNTSRLTQIAALACIKYRNLIYEQNNLIINERLRIIGELNSYSSIEILPSDSNYFLIKFKDKSIPLKFFWELKDNYKILVRHFNKPGLYPYIRVTVGTEEENNRFLEAFKKIAEKNLH